jgi:hypothetical protein
MRNAKLVQHSSHHKLPLAGSWCHDDTMICVQAPVSRPDRTRQTRQKGRTPAVLPNRNTGSVEMADLLVEAAVLSEPVSDRGYPRLIGKIQGIAREWA